MQMIFFEGFLLQASLIFALGSQNLFIIEQSLAGHKPWLMSFICFFCDLVLIMFGVAGMGVLFVSIPEFKILMGVLGVILMMYYGLDRLSNNSFNIPVTQITLKKTTKHLILLSMIFSWLNPHAYLDAFILIGGQSIKYGEFNERIFFGLGAAFFSLLWFLFLSHISGYFSIYLKNMFRLFNLGSVLLFFILAIKLSTEVKVWIVDLYQKIPPNISSQ
jgi:L-lysine exporter family protein LysE/ArgO